MIATINKVAAYSLFIIGAGWVSCSQAAISLDRTRIIFSGSDKSVSIGIKNQNSQLPFLAQGWLEDSAGNKIQSPMVVLPPVQRLEPGRASQIKIQSVPAIKALPQDRETLFYFNLREIPPRSNKTNTLQIALQTRIKLFYRPASLAIDTNMSPPQEKLELRRQGDQYVVNNPTAYYVTIVDGRPGNGVSPKDFEPVMVAPKSSGKLSVSATEMGSHPELVYINDYGGRPTLSFQCGGAACRLIPANKSSQ